jgi:hypothetical protein
MSTAVEAAMEYAGALPATAMTTESRPPRAPRRSPSSGTVCVVTLSPLERSAAGTGGLPTVGW